LIQEPLQYPTGGRLHGEDAQKWLIGA
jgi:hypothetical protein